MFYVCSCHSAIISVASTAGMNDCPQCAAERLGLQREAVVGKDGKDAERVTTTLSKSQKAELERLAKKQGVAVAWLIRRAVESYLEEQAGGPMLPLEGTDDAKR
jgi:hypothetical protein